MNIKFNVPTYTFEELLLGMVCMKKENPNPKEIYLRIEEFTTADGDTYNAINLTNMEYAVFDDAESVIPYNATITLE